MKKTLILALVFTLAISCKNYLDIKPYGKTIPRTPDEFSSLLHNYLNNIDYGESLIVGNIPSIIDLECYADNIEANLTSYPEGNFLPLYIGSHLSGKQGDYEKLYACIRDCNIVIGNMKNDGSSLASDVLGTAHALRGLCYYNLLRDFCEPPVGNPDGPGLPMVTSFDMEERPLRGKIREASELIENDYLQSQKYGVSNPVYRFNNEVIDGLLARLYFWTGDWDKALNRAVKVLEKHPLIKGEEYSAMIKSYVGKKGNILFKSTIIITGKELEYNGVVNYAKHRPVSKRFLDLFPEGKNDIRYDLSIGEKRKFSKVPIACLRSAEMQLIKAECLYHKGDAAGALNALNELRRNRIEGAADWDETTLPAVNKDEFIKKDAQGKELTPLISAILSERRKELFMEGDRWYELKRNGRPQFWVAKQGRKYTVEQFMYTFPLPVTDVFLIKGLVQNPGYEKAE